ncbi:MAG: hypothetical protein HETSPECPRED_008466 [Heterodermia speciosa]|uniref:Uncharacterized protein n=1 Tax=Heterodermia speciosa TaxID=116794 RepID=A0A8H3FY87_9LECA|nr:MAG: hypothetical protein HETSPECPRED_008466 [Heterodermia speciosa]
MNTSVSYGRYAGRRLDQSLGHRSFGKTTVDCAFLSNKSHWGTLDHESAGLLRLALNIHEPAGYKLSSAEIHLCFYHSEQGPWPNVTEHLYPEILCGPPLSRHKTRTRDVEPSVEALSTSVGGVGVHNIDEWSETFRWLLRGSRLPDEFHGYSKAEWSWQANKWNEQSELRRAFQLGMVITHCEPRLKVSVSIKGRLRDGFRDGLRIFKLVESKRSQTDVHVEFSQKKVELESIISTLAAELANLNTEAIPGHGTPSGLNVTPNDSSMDTSGS